MKKFILSFVMLLATGSLVSADAITFEAAVNSPRISLDEVLQLTLTVTGVNDNLDPISLPVLDGFSAKYLGPSTRISIINGDYHSQKSFVYNLFPNKVGRFQIPPITATLSGQAYTTKPIDVEVFQNTAQAQAPSQPSDQNGAPSDESLKDKIVVIASVDKTDVYLNGQIPLTVKLLYRDVPVRSIQYPQFDKTGIVVDDYEKPQEGSLLVNGVKYDGVEFKTNIYPNHLGDLTVGPVQIQGNVLYKTHQESPFNQENNPFGAEIFNNFFDSYAARPITVASQPIQLHVLPLPEHNRPADFSGAIGQFNFQASVAPQQVKAGDPLTLKMSVQGNGNFKNFKMPVFHGDGFKSYAPQIKDTGDAKTVEEVIIPTSASIKEVPALQFSYFDTSTKDYKTITQGPFAIQVTAISPDQDFKAIGFSDVSHEPVLPTNQFSFRMIFNGIAQVLRKLGSSIWFWLSMGLILVAGVSYFLWRRFQDRLENDPAFARRLKAVKEARKALGPAEGYISTGKTKDFYALLSKVLRDYLANKWHQTSAALSTNEILSHLKASKLDEAHIEQIKTILERSDLVCFAGATFESEKMRTDLSHAQNLIAQLEKQLK
jgi:hypothetical protein